MEPIPGFEHRALDLARPDPNNADPSEVLDPCGGRPAEPQRPGSLGRPKPSGVSRPRQPAQVVTTGSRNHIVYTDQKGRKMPYNEPKFNPINHVKRMESNHQTQKGYSISVGIYGWRKRCLYILIVGLMVMMVINLALTLWVLKVLDFNFDGMGQLRVVPGGLQLLGQAMAMDSLYASTIRSRRGQPITIESSRNFSINTRDHEGYLENQLFLGHDRMECMTRSFRVTDPRGVPVFSADAGEVVIGAEALRVSGAGGVSLAGSLQTPLVRASSGNQLLLESPTRSLEIRAAQSIKLESRAGDISASCLTNLRLQSVAGAIKLEAGSIFMPKLKSALPLPANSAHSRDPHHHDIYQLCACANGKLFLASPHGICAAKEDSYICR